MGIALGLGIIVGVRAVGGSWSSVTAIIVLLVGLAVVMRPPIRTLCVVALIGCLVGVAAGALRTERQSPVVGLTPTGPFTGVIRGDPDVTPMGAIADFDWTDSTGLSGTAVLFLPPAPQVGRGDHVIVIGSVEGARSVRIFAERVRVIRGPNSFERWRRSFRSLLSEVMTTRVPGSPGALALGLLTGDDSALTAPEQEDLRRAGLSHITAVSGWNVMLVTSTVGMIFLKLGLRRWPWSLLQLTALLGFVWIVGFEPPVTRAAIMAAAGIVAVRLGRPAHTATVLTMSAAVMVAVSPAALTTLSFQLSVVASAGLVVANHISRELEGWRAIALTPVAVTAVIGLMTAPLLATEFGTLSLATIPANLLGGPFVPLTTILAIVIVGLSPIAPLADLVGLIVWVLCSSLLWIARTIGAAPGVYHEFAPLSDSSQAGLYTLLTVGIVAALPEGRLISRTVLEWARREPLSASLGAGVACFVLIVAAFAV